jgi:hypothetical protein
MKSSAHGKATREQNRGSRQRLRKIRSILARRKDREAGGQISLRTGLYTGLEIFSAPEYGETKLGRMGTVKTDLFFLEAIWTA